MAPRLPQGTVTFMLTDLQGSTRAWQERPKAMRTAMARHDSILAGSVHDHSGQLVEAGREGDSVLAVFRTAATAAACALDIQKKFASESWPEGLELKVRLALHTGEAQLRGDHYSGLALNRCARLLATCHPGQILLTKATEAMLTDEVPVGAALQDLGLHRFKDLARPEQIFQLADLNRPSEFPRIQSLSERQTNMPHYLTTFVGRGAELTSLQSVLTQSRMVTLTGAGGSGKSRLAAELGRACLRTWSGGVWWVDLAPVDDPRQVSSAVVAALDLPGLGPALDVIVAWLAPRRAVLVLDNCEHVVAAGAELCLEALHRCTELTIITTSREALGVPGEVRRAVSSMRATDAVQLFEARGRLAVPDYKVTASNLETVTRICERLDGMPLAIELAAARLGMLTEREILGQLSDRFRLLTGGSRTAAERQQTMVATIDWSYRLLTQHEATLFRRLAVFRGGFSLESVHVVCGGDLAGRVLDLLTGLVDKSMVIADPLDDGTTRYRLLETQLAYAEDRLREGSELELMQRRHYGYFRDQLSTMANLERVVAEREWITRESTNLWAAVAWARDNTDDLGLSLALDFTPGVRDLTQARTLLEDLLARSPASGALRARALRGVAFLAWQQGDLEASVQAAEECVSLARELGDAEFLARALNVLGMAYQGRGELAVAGKLFEEASALLKSSTSRAWVVVRNSVGIHAVHSGDYVAACAILTEVVDRARSQDLDLYAACLDSLAYAQLGLNDLTAAAASWREALTICRHGGDDHLIFLSLEGLTCISSVRGHDGRALRLAGAAIRMAGTLSLSSDPWLSRQFEESRQRSGSRLGAGSSEDAWQQGWAMATDQAIDYALADIEPEIISDSSPLSRREQEVAKLVAEGMTNRQIAERLFIAERSAEGHLERIRNKLGVRSRTEVATWAIGHGLTPASKKEKGTPR